MSLSYIVNDAILKAWCNPGQDLQSIVEPKRITRQIGVWSEFTAGKISYALPDSTSRFHVFQIGQLSPALMGLLETHGTWALASDTCHQKKMIIDIYNSVGVQFPRTQAWYMVTKNRNLLFAIKEVPSILADIRQDSIFLRVYTNAFFQSRRAGVMADDIRVMGRSPKTVDDILALQNTFNQWSLQAGVTYAFVNGIKVSHVNLFSAKVGDYVEFIYDSSVHLVLDFMLSDLRAFDSTLDTKNKYLLHYSGQGSNTIDYHDDIDFFVVHKNPLQGWHRGVYYHRNAGDGDAVRMVTHKDYAVPTDYISAYLAANPTWPVGEVMLRAHVRYSGYFRPLIDEANRIKELYKMPDADVLNAMVSVDAVVPNWTAAALEAAAYTEVMRSPTANMSPTLVQNAYGYNAMSKLLADSPLLPEVVSGRTQVEVPYGLQLRSVAYEYDANGLLLGYYQHIQGVIYVPRNSGVKLVEFVVGTLDTQLDETYGQQVVPIDVTADYRLYTCGIEFDGTVNNHWVDVTGSSNYAIVNGVVTWLTDPATTYTLVRGNRNVLGYGVDLDNSSGVLLLTLTHLAMRGGSIGNHVMQIPMGELDVFLNGRSLVEGLDYYVSFPAIVITNKRYLKSGTTQHVDVRFTGLCKSDLTREHFDEKGFINHELLSANNRYDIRDDKVQRIMVDGAIYDRRELLFAENDLGVVVPNAQNGAPYWLRDVVVPLRGQAVDDTYTLRAQSLVTDHAVSSYLTSKLPQQTFPNPNAITDLYPIVSPFCSKLLFDLKNGVLADPRLKAFYADADVFDICRPYEYLLAFDPTQDPLRPDPNYVAIHPHHLNTTVAVDLYCYKFLTRAVKLYLKDRVSLTNFVTLSA